LDNRPPELPGWMTGEEVYIPGKDKSAFVNKSILSVLGLLSRIKTQDTKAASKYMPHAVFMVFGTLLLVVLLSFSRGFTFPMVALVYLLVLLAFMDGRAIRSILKVSLIAALGSALVLLPAALNGSAFTAVLITGKVFAGITAVNLLSHSAKWNDISAAFKRFLVPDLFIFVFDITVKYIYMLGDYLLNMLYALKLRSVGVNRNKYASLSGIGGNLFLRSSEMAGDMYGAMECRGFTGKYRAVKRFRISPADLLFIGANLAIVIAFIYLGRVKK